MKDLLTSDIVVRAFKTFVQAFLATLAAGVLSVVNLATGKALIVSALAAGASAVWNTILFVKNK